VLAATGPSHALAQSTQGTGDPPPSVTVAPVVVKDIAPAQTFIGRVAAIEAVQIVPRVTAFIEDIPVSQGSHVKAGQILFRLEQTQYAAAVQAAQAQLASANAALLQSEQAYQRAAQLTQRDVATQASLEQAQATRDQNKANVQAARANLDQARLNLSYTTIAAPIAGRIGAVSLTKGNLVTPSTPALVTVNQLDPIRVVFSVSRSGLRSPRSGMVPQRTSGWSRKKCAPAAWGWGEGCRGDRRSAWEGGMGGHGDDSLSDSEAEITRS
jgi:membrane fusion protein (multidrug efflux system)